MREHSGAPAGVRRAPKPMRRPALPRARRAGALCGAAPEIELPRRGGSRAPRAGGGVASRRGARRARSEAMDSDRATSGDRPAAVRASGSTTCAGWSHARVGAADAAGERRKRRRESRPPSAPGSSDQDAHGRPMLVTATARGTRGRRRRIRLACTPGSSFPRRSRGGRQSFRRRATGRRCRPDAGAGRDQVDPPQPRRRRRRRWSGSDRVGGASPHGSRATAAPAAMGDLPPRGGEPAAVEGGRSRSRRRGSRPSRTAFR